MIQYIGLLCGAVVGAFSSLYAMFAWLKTRVLVPDYETVVGFVCAAIPNLAAILVFWLIQRVGERSGIKGECQCRKCGYILRGLREPRCSECGERI